MLHCVYHPVDDMQVVDDENKARLLATGFWFDHPTKALEARKAFEEEVKMEMEPNKTKKRGRPRKGDE